MRRAMRVLAIGLVSMSLGGASRPAADARFMFPAIIILRGGGIGMPIIFNHAGAVGGNVSADTIAILYGSLTLRAPKSEDRVRRRPFIEVAEFFGAPYVGYASGLVPPPAFERGNHFSRIYLPADGEPALWRSPVVAPGGAAPGFYELGDAGKRVLATRGLKLR